MARHQGQVTQEVPSGAINSSNTSFALTHAPIDGTISLYQTVNGAGVPVLKTVTTHYTVSGKTITMVTAPATGDLLWAVYF
jgi:hypothetical protein